MFLSAFSDKISCSCIVLPIVFGEFFLLVILLGAGSSNTEITGRKFFLLSIVQLCL